MTDGSYEKSATVSVSSDDPVMTFNEEAATKGHLRRPDSILGPDHPDNCMSPTPALDKALLEAQLLASPIVKDAKSDKYRYVKGETIFIAASRVLLRSGLVARRRWWKIATNPIHETKYGDKNRICGETRIISMLMEVSHPESGQRRTEQVEFPAVMQLAMPLDKAVAAALTTSLAYWLRDLLLIPRVDEEMDKRNDEDFEPGGTTKQEAIAALNQKLKEIGCGNPAEADAVVRYVAIDSKNASPMYAGIEEVREGGVAGIVLGEIYRELSTNSNSELLAKAKDAANLPNEKEKQK